MKTNFKCKLLVGTAAVALFAAAPGRDAIAQYVSGGQAPGTFSASAEGGYAIGTSTNNSVWGEAPAGYHGDPEPYGAVPLSVGGGDGFVGRAALGYQYDPHWSFGIMYTGLRTSQSSGQNGLLATVQGGGTKWGHPQTGYNGSVKTSIAADIVDFQVGYDYGLGRGGIATALIGIEYGRFGQKTDVTMHQGCGYSCDPSAGTDRNSTFSGVGPTLGVKGQMPLTGDVRHGLGLVGQVQGGVLFGSLDSDTTAYGLYDPTSRDIDHDRTAETVQAQLGLTYAVHVGASSDLQLALGYQVMYFAGVRDSRNGVSEVGATYGSETDDLLYHGPFARLTLNFGATAAPPPPPPPPAPPSSTATVDAPIGRFQV